MSRNITHVVFDFDGVIADTENVFAQFDAGLINDVLARAGVAQRLSVEDCRALAGNPGEGKLAIIGGRFDVDLGAFESAFVETRTEARKRLFRDRPAPLGTGLKAFLELLDGRCALATNKTSAKLFHDMRMMGLESLFEIIVPCDPPYAKKPTPDILLAAAKELSVAAEDCAYIGDNTLDMQAATAAGMMPVGFVIEGVDGHAARVEALRDAGAEIVIDDFMDLKAYLTL